MKPLVKKILIGTGIAMTVSAIVAYQKAMKIATIFEAMDIEPAYLTDLDINLNNKAASFKLDVRLTNNTADDLFISGVSVASLELLHIYYNNVFLATAKVNIKEIAIPSRNELIIKAIPVTVSIANILKVGGSLLSFDMDKITVIGVVSALGKKYEIGTE